MPSEERAPTFRARDLRQTGTGQYGWQSSSIVLSALVNLLVLNLARTAADSRKAPDRKRTASQAQRERIRADQQFPRASA